VRHIAAVGRCASQLPRKSRAVGFVSLLRGAMPRDQVVKLWTHGMVRSAGVALSVVTVILGVTSGLRIWVFSGHGPPKRHAAHRVHPLT
jgi:hypothetical protein